MELEWDQGKHRINLRKHGIDFRDAAEVFAGHTVTVEDSRMNYGERRFATFGLLAGRVVVLLHTERGDAIRLISMRKASKHEERSYFRSLED